MIKLIINSIINLDNSCILTCIHFSTLTGNMFCCCSSTPNIDSSVPLSSQDIRKRYRIRPYSLPPSSKRNSTLISNGVHRRNPKILCLHGWRTSGYILSMQMAAFRYHTEADYYYIDAPYPSEGDPDEGIQAFYNDLEYFEWFYKRFDENGQKTAWGLDESIQMLMDYINDNGPFDGILGFSQGCIMATKILAIYEKQYPNAIFKHKIKFVILIGGVPPSNEIDKSFDLIQSPSLHIMGSQDSLLHLNQELVKFYHPSSSTIYLHDEGHNIPSIRTDLYSKIKSWIYEKYDSTIS